MSYSYTDGDGLTVLDKTKPNGASEPVSIVDDAIRQIKAFLQDTTAGYAALVARVAAAEATIGGVAGSQRNSFRAYTGANQSIAGVVGGGPETKVTFDQESLDPDNCFDTGSNAFSAPSAGLFLFHTALRVDTTASAAPTGISLNLHLFVNNARVATAERMVQSTDGTTIEMTRLLSLSSGDDVDVRYAVSLASGTLTSQVTTDPSKTVFEGFRII